MNFSIKRHEYILIILFFAFTLSCGNEKESNNKNEQKLTHENIQNHAKKIIKLDIKTLNKNKTEFVIGEEIEFLIEQKDSNQLDSIQFFVNNQFMPRPN